nr:acetylornithine aminotransferase [Parachlamydiaceae bacterium]
MKKNETFTLSKDLAAQALHDDKRIIEAKRLIKEAVIDHQKNIKQVTPPIESLKESYEEMVNSMTAFRGGKLWFPFIGSGIGNGCLVELADGSVKYDFITGVGVHFLGHSHPSLIEAGFNAAISDTIMQGNLQQNVDSVRLSELLTKVSGMPHC